jgi:hypothetical protein
VPAKAATKPAAATAPKAPAAPKANAAPKARTQELRAEAKRLIGAVNKHYTANGQHGSPSHRYIDSTIKTTFGERQQIRTYLWHNYKDVAVPGLKDIKYYIVGAKTTDKIDITGHRHSNGKDKSLESHTNVFNYHVNWTS